MSIDDLSTAKYADLPCEEKLRLLEDDVMPIVKDISRHTIKARKAMEQNPVTTLVLSNAQVDLAILNQRLGERVAWAGAVEREADNLLSTVRERHKVRLTQGYDEDGVKTKPIAAGVADSMKVGLVEAEHDLWNRAKHMHERLKYLRTSTDKTIDTIRSKLTYERADLRNA